MSQDAIPRETVVPRRGASLPPALDVAVIICAYTSERWEILTRALGSVRAQTHEAREIILVVDGNAELQQRCEATFADVAVVANRHPGGLSGGRRTGAELA